MRTDDVTRGREEAARDDEDRCALLRERPGVGQVVHVEPVRDVQDVDRDARRITQQELDADDHGLVRRRDGRNRHALVADVVADSHTGVARGNVPIQEVHPCDGADDGEDNEEYRGDFREPRHAGGPPPDTSAAAGGAPEDNPTSPAK